MHWYGYTRCGEFLVFLVLVLGRDLVALVVHVVINFSHRRLVFRLHLIKPFGFVFLFISCLWSSVLIVFAVFVAVIIIVVAALVAVAVAVAGVMFSQ